jgi:hypothetical protein
MKDEGKRMKWRSLLFWIVLVTLLLWRVPHLSAEKYRWVNSSGVVHTTSLSNMIITTAGRLSVDPALVEAIVAVESAFDPRAVSPKGAMGLMQLMPQTASRYGVSDPFDPYENLTGGIRYLRDLIRLFHGDLTKVLAAYNAGENAVLRYRGVPPYRETRNYVRKVLSRYQPAPPSPSIVSTWQLARDVALIRVELMPDYLLPDGSRRGEGALSMNIGNVSSKGLERRGRGIVLVRGEARENPRTPESIRRVKKPAPAGVISAGDTSAKNAATYRPLTKLSPPPLIHMKRTRTILVNLPVHRSHRTREFSSY